jgi:hypothetical protein
MGVRKELTSKRNFLAGGCKENAGIIGPVIDTGCIGEMKSLVVLRNSAKNTNPFFLPSLNIIFLQTYSNPPDRVGSISNCALCSSTRFPHGRKIHRQIKMSGGVDPRKYGGRNLAPRGRAGNRPRWQ